MALLGEAYLKLLGFAAIGALALAAAAMPAAPARLRAGAASVRITPSLTRPVFLAGYENNRVADSVHDDLWARALVLDDGRTRVAVVACDLIGLTNRRVRRMRQRVRSIPGGAVLIAATHVHSGPDTLGLWGPSPLRSGLDPLYMARLEDRVAAAVEAAARELRPVRVSAGETELPEGLLHNIREPVQDRALGALRFTGDGGETVATVIHCGGHPEVNRGRALTSDFVHHARESVEARFGGLCLFLNGALGGMVTPRVAGANGGYNLSEMRRVGQGVGRAAVAALEGAATEPDPALLLRRREVAVPLENDRFRLAVAAGILDGAADGGRLTSEVWRLGIGRVTWLALPGEILPAPALELKSRLPGRVRMVVALANDELGYILDPADFDRELYRYERSMSVGRQTWPILRDAARELLEQP